MAEESSRELDVWLQASRQLLTFCFEAEHAGKRRLLVDTKRAALADPLFALALEQAEQDAPPWHVVAKLRVRLEATFDALQPCTDQETA